MDIPNKMKDLSGHKSLDTIDEQAQYWLQISLSSQFYEAFKNGKITQEQKDLLYYFAKTGRFLNAAENFVAFMNYNLSAERWIKYVMLTGYRRMRKELMITNAELRQLSQLVYNGEILRSVKIRLQLAYRSPDETLKMIVKEAWATLDEKSVEFEMIRSVFADGIDGEKIEVMIQK